MRAPYEHFRLPAVCFGLLLAGCASRAELAVAARCSPEQGFDLGRAGATQRADCPAHMQKSYLAGYRQGQAVRELLARQQHARDRRLEQPRPEPH